MLYELLYSFSSELSFLNVTRYISFRAIIALLSSLLIGIIFTPWFIKLLQKHQMGQVVRSDGPKTHLSKVNTPTMGGGIIVVSILLSSLLWISSDNRYLWYAMFILVSYAVIGFVDDYKKIHLNNSRGLGGKYKLLFQILFAAIVCTHNYIHSPSVSYVSVPFIKHIVVELGPLYILFSVLVIIGTSNAVNLTDGLDGLAIGPIMVAALCYSILAYVSGNKMIAEYLHFPYIAQAGELTILSACLIGAGMAFLWYNTYPAQLFMGDVGSLPLGGLIGCIAVFSKHELLLVIIGGIFVLEAVSVMTQVASFKLTGKRIFRMAPLHHHFELKGWPEPKVIVRFWIISFMLALVGLLSLKLR